MENNLVAAEQISLFCRLNLNAKRQLPIRSSEMGMLIYLCKTQGEKTPMSIARFFGVSKAMATNMVTAMHKQGYIEKRISVTDRRSSSIYPTEKAELLVSNTYEEYSKTIVILKQRMGEKDFNTMLSLLQQANNILLEEKSHE